MAALCEDEVLGIFSWLPVKSICKFKSICESYLNFTKDTYFCMKHAQNMLLQDDTSFFIQQDTRQRLKDKIQVHSLYGSDELELQSFLNLLAKSPAAVKILASSNGLVLCRSTSRNRSEVELFICNLVTKAWLPIPTPESVREDLDHDINLVFQCINNNLDVDDYRITLIERSYENWPPHLDLKVYLSKEGVWKAMERSFVTRVRDMRLDMPVSLHNNLYLISDCFPYILKSCLYFRPYILAYNFESGQSTMLRLPKDARRGSHDKSCNMGIFEWGKKANNSNRSICLVRLRKCVFTVWILVDYKSTSWRRILKIRVKAMGLKEEDPKVEGFSVMNGDRLIFATEKKVYGYDLCGQDFQRSKEICEHEWGTKVCFTSYSNTLRPCGTGAKIIDGYFTTHSKRKVEQSTSAYSSFDF